MSKIKRITAIILLFCMVFLVCSCGEYTTSEDSTDEINPMESMKIADLSSEVLIVGKKSVAYTLEIDESSDYTVNNISAVISDSTVVEVEIDNSDNLFSDSVTFYITGKSAGTATLYFETSDKSAISNSTEITVLADISEIKFSQTATIQLEVGNSTTCKFEIAPQNLLSFTNDDFVFISENDSIAKIKSSDDFFCTITAVKPGTTYVYMRSANSTVKSDKLRVTVKEVTTTHKQSTVTSAQIKNSVTVYITPTGKRYHYSKACAGKNAMARDLDSVTGIYTPCKKCAQ